MKIIRRVGESELVELARWNYERYIIPAGTTDVALIREMGILYGEDWVALAESRGWPKQFARDFGRELRRRGIYTLDDLKQKHQEATGAFRQVAGLEIAALRRAAQLAQMEAKNE